MAGVDPKQFQAKEPSHIPGSTYRFQFHREFPLTKAAEVVDYLSELGITDLYSSPLLKARPASTHGYDCVDHSKLNEEIGSAEQLAALSDSLKKKGISVLLDIVPNHAATDPTTNLWWADVLEHGKTSLYAAYFDINWNHPTYRLTGKVLLPILGDHLPRVLHEKQLNISWNQTTGWRMNYFSNALPIDISSLLPVFEEAMAKLPLSANSAPTAQFIRTVLEQMNAIPDACPPTMPAVTYKQERLRMTKTLKDHISAAIHSDAQLAAALQVALQNVNLNPKLLQRVLDRQNYRLAYWRSAADEINYRRFFDINELIGVRVEDEAVFRDTHALPFEWLAQGKISGMRIDHPDGLSDPVGYLSRLQKTAASVLVNTHTESPLYCLVEKILEPGESLPGNWKTHGTTGYDFMNQLNAVFVRTDNAPSMLDVYEKFLCLQLKFADVLYESKRLILETSLAGEVSYLSSLLTQLCAEGQFTDWTAHQLRHAIVEFISFFPVYRTYVSDTQSASSFEQELVHGTAAKVLGHTSRWNSIAHRNTRGIFLEDSLVHEFTRVLLEHPFRSEVHRAFVTRFQQLTGPAMAKGLEDTTFYRYFLLLSLNEVGGEPAKFGADLEEFHKQMAQRLATFPWSMSASTTHDTKRSEDCRARINVLSEIPSEWAAAVKQFSQLALRHKTTVQEVGEVPLPNEEYFLYQTLVGVWPIGLNAVAPDTLIQRVKDYAIKSARESKMYTNWTESNERYEKALLSFIENVMRDEKFLGAFLPFQRLVSDFGKWNSLSQLALKVTLPGIPDVYQGTELWCFSLVDPDNRRPVDFTLRRNTLREVLQDASRGTATLTQTIASLSKPAADQDGKLKMLITAALLRYRRENQSLFNFGSYLPIRATGPRGTNVIGFMRAFQNKAILVLAGRFFASMQYSGADSWAETVVTLPAIAEYAKNSRVELRDVITQSTYSLATEKAAAESFIRVPMKEIFSALPIAVLELNRVANLAPSDRN